MIYRKSIQPNLPNAECILKNVSFDKIMIDNPKLFKRMELEHKKFVERGMIPVV